MANAHDERETGDDSTAPMMETPGYNRGSPLNPSRILPSMSPPRNTSDLLRASGTPGVDEDFISLKQENGSSSDQTIKMDRLIRLRRYSAKRISAEKRRNSGGPKTFVPKFGMGWSPPVPYDPLRRLGAHGHMPHATCGNAWANRGQPMGHGYDIRVIVVHCDRHYGSWDPHA